MQMIEIPDNQSGTSHKLLKTRHPARRIYRVIEPSICPTIAITRLHYVLFFALIWASLREKIKPTFLHD